MTLEYKVTGLGCATCAAKIQRAVAELDGVQDARLDLAACRLTLECESAPPRGFEHRLTRLAGRIERGVSFAADNAHARQVQDPDAPPARRITPLAVGRILLAVSAVLLVAGLCVDGIARAVLLGGGVLAAGYDTFWRSLRGLVRLQIDENLLVTIAVIAAFIIGEYPEAAMVMLLYRLGEELEHVASGRSSREIEKLSEIRPDTAHLLADPAAEPTDCRAEQVQPGSLILVRPFERIPLDGVVEQGESALDASALTGESLPVHAGPGTEVLSGMQNTEGLLFVRTTKNYENSTASRILGLVRESAAAKGKAEKFITRFAKVYTPCVTAAAVLIAVIPPLFGASWLDWLYRALVFLVASCPCALVISVPLSFFAAVGAASRHGVLIKGGKFVEALAKADTVVFDKTGTLTRGELQVSEVFATGGRTREEVLALAARAEQNSAHPIARAICRAGGDPKGQAGKYTELPGYGVRYENGGSVVLCGGRRLMEREGVDLAGLPEAQVYLAVDGKAAGAVSVADTVRDEAAAAVAELRELGVKRMAMLTGDGEAAAASVAAVCGIREYHAGLMPEDKVAQMRALSGHARGSVFVGDGINDAPVLACADVGAAMGLGTDAAIEAADVVLSGNSLRGLPKAIRISRKAMGIVRFNIAFALGVKAAVLITALFVPLMWAAVLADVGVSLIAVLNASRVLRA